MMPELLHRPGRLYFWNSQQFSLFALERAGPPLPQTQCWCGESCPGWCNQFGHWRVPTRRANIASLVSAEARPACAGGAWGEPGPVARSWALAALVLPPRVAPSQGATEGKTTQDAQTDRRAPSDPRPHSRARGRVAVARSIGGMGGNGGKKESERERAELQQGALGQRRLSDRTRHHCLLGYGMAQPWLALGEQARVFCGSARPGPSGREVKSLPWEIGRAHV